MSILLAESILLCLVTVNIDTVGPWHSSSYAYSVERSPMIYESINFYADVSLVAWHIHLTLSKPVVSNGYIS